MFGQQHDDEVNNWLQTLGPGWDVRYIEGGGADAPTRTPQYYQVTNPANVATFTDVGADATRKIANISVNEIPYSLGDKNKWQYTPQQLGWSPEDTARFSGAGVTNLPGWMGRENIFSNNIRLGGDDPVQEYIRAFGMATGASPIDQKYAERALSGMGWAREGDQWKNIGTFRGNPHGTGDLNTTYLADPSMTWGDLEKQAFVTDYLQGKWKPNDSGFFGTENLTGMLAGLGAVAAPIAGLGALGGFAGLGAAPALGAVGGAELSTALAGLSPAQIAAEFPAMAGTSLLGGTGAATPGFFGSGIGLGADAALGGLFGTGVGLSNLPAGGLGAMLSGGWDSLTGMLDKVDWAKLAGAVPGMVGGTAPVSLYTGTPGVSGGSPQVSPIPQDTGMGGPSRMSGGIMPTASVMGAYGKDRDRDRMDYFRSIF